MSHSSHNKFIERLKTLQDFRSGGNMLFRTLVSSLFPCTWLSITKYLGVVGGTCNHLWAVCLPLSLRLIHRQVETVACTQKLLFAFHDVTQEHSQGGGSVFTVCASSGKGAGLAKAPLLPNPHIVLAV